MKKSTILKPGLLALIFLQSLMSYSQNWVSYIPKQGGEVKPDLFRIAKEPSLIQPFTEFTAEPANAKITAAPPGNPAIKYTETPYLGIIAQCPNGGPVLPVLFLCGNAETRLIDTGIKDAVSVTWYRFNSGSCPPAANSNCANETASASCWSIIGRAPDYLVGNDGQYKVVIVDKTNTSYTYYFNATKTPSNNATFTKSDIITFSGSGGANSCSIEGRISVGGFSSGYEYCFTQNSTSEGGVWQDSKLFQTDIKGTYNIFVRLKGVPGSCVFNIGSQTLIESIKKDLAFTFTPYNIAKCNKEEGSFLTNIVDEENPNIPFIYRIYKVDSKTNVSTLVETYGPTFETQYFSDKYKTTNGTTGGNETFQCRVTTSYSDCFDFTYSNFLNFPAELQASLEITEKLTPCGSNGRIKITAIGGTGKFTYKVTSSDGRFTVLDNMIQVFAAGTYEVEVKDVAGCLATASIVVPKALKPEYTIEKTASNSCFGDNTGSIKINITNPNGYIISYSIDNGVTFQPGNTFSYLPSGTYDVVIQYSTGITSCTLLEKVTIEGPTSSLSATASITALSGCGPAGNELQGKVTITNAQGGVPFSAPNLYQYSFDGGKTWQTSNTAFINPGGPYIFYIKDAAGCIYAMSAINMPAKPTAPVISIDTVYTCDGNTITVTVKGGSSDFVYSYLYYIDGKLNTNTVNPNVFLNVGSGPHKITVEYKANSTLYPEATACGTKLDFPITIDANKTFSAAVINAANVKCNGGSDGGFTITAVNFDPVYGFDYSLDGGLTWINSKVSPVIITGQKEGTYQIKVRYNNTAAGCSFSLTQKITAPKSLTVSKVDIVTPATCLTGATIKVTVSGGTGGYQYQLLDGTTKAIIIDFQNSNTFTNVQPGSYIVVVKDANGCQSQNSTINVVIAAPDKPVATINEKSLCYDGSKAAIIVNITGGVAPYTYQVQYLSGALSPAISITGSSFTYDAKETGGYTFIITDANGCQTTAVSATIDAKLTATTKTTVSLSCTNTPGKIEVTLSNGTAPYTYVVRDEMSKVLYESGNITGPTFTYTTDKPSRYSFVIKDKNSCQLTVYATIAPITNPTVTAAFTPVTCNGLSNGSVVLTGHGGSGSYEFSDKPATGFSASTAFSNLPAGKHTFYVKDSNGCTGQIEIEIKEPGPINASASVTTPYTCDTNAVITATASGGNSGFTYVLSFTINGVTTIVAKNTTGIFENLTVAGDYTVTVTDAKLCSPSPVVINAGTIEAIVKPSAMVITNTALKCPSNKVEVTIESVTGGKGPYEYAITAPATSIRPYQSSNIFKDLAPGTYTFIVKDANKCTFSMIYTIAALPVISIKSSVVSNVQCKGESNGSIKYTISGLGNDASYSYIFDGGTPVTGTTSHTGNSFDLEFTGLSAGEHTLTVTNTTTTCSVTKKQKVAAPTAALTVVSTTVTPVTCKENGTVVINASGGWGGYVYTIKTPSGIVMEQTDKTFKDLVAGEYSFLVKDSGKCTSSTGTFIIESNVTIDAVIDASKTACYDATSGATIKVNPNTHDNYIYSLNGAVPQNNGTFAGLTAGTYKIRVIDTSTGCYKDLEEQTVISSLTASTNVKIGPKCDSSIIEIEGEVKGGTPNYTYTVTINGDVTSDPTVYHVTGNAFSYTNTVAATAATATTYLFTFADAAGCTTTSTEIIQPKTDPEITSALQANVIKCNGGTTGSINVVINPAKGVGPYDINVTKSGTPNVDYGTKTTGLPAGNYTITVTDANGCATTASAVIIQPDPIVVDVETKGLECIGDGVSQGKIIIKSVSGGTKNYDYYITGNNTTQHKANETGSAEVVFDVNFGLYQIKVVDNNSCDVQVSNVMIAAPVDELDIDITTTVNCTGGTATVTIGSTFTSEGPFHFNIYKGPGQVWTADNVEGWQGESSLGSKTTTFTPLIPGATYSFIVYDQTLKCYYYQTAEMAIPFASGLTVDAVVANNRSCAGSNDGNVSFDIVNGYTSSVDVSYQVYESISNVPVGIAGTGTIAAGATLHVDQLGLGFLPVGSYYVLVRETSGTNAGCGVPTASFNIKESASLLRITASATKNANCNAQSGIIEAFAQGGSTISASPGVAAVPYLYQIFPDNGAPAPTADSFLVASHTSNTFKADAGKYLVYVRDAYGCIQVAPVTVVLDPAPTMKAEVINPCTATEGKFEIKVTLLTTGVGDHTYSLDGGTFRKIASTPFTLSNLSSKTHTVTIKDANNCSVEESIKIEPPLEIDASFTTVPDCTTANGKITAIASGGSGVGNYEFTLVNNTVAGTDIVQMNDGIFKNVAAGSYTVKVKDLITGCDKSKDVSLVVRTAIDFSLDSTPSSCTAGQGNNNNGTITVTLTNTDNAQYEYVLEEILSSGVIKEIKTQTTSLFTGLTAGDYWVTVKSDNGCEDKKPVTIPDAVPVTATLDQDDFKCNAKDLKAKEVTITPAGGSGTGAITDYMYSNDGQKWITENIFEVIDTGQPQQLTYYVKDSKGCIFSKEITIAPFPKLTSPEVTFGPAMDCDTNKQEINVVIKGGTSTPNPFTYQVYEDGELVTGKLSVTGNAFTYYASKAGSYYQFEIFDNNTTCSIMTDPYEVPLFNDLKVVAIASAEVACKGDSTGTITINVTGYSGHYTYEILKEGLSLTPAITGEGDTALGATVTSGLPAGTNYTVMVKETTFPKCSGGSNEVDITEPLEPLSLSSDLVNVNQNCNTLGAVVTVPITSVTGGTPDYMYAFVQDGTSPDGFYTNSNTATLDPALNTEWDVWVMDKNKCAVKADITIAKDPLPSAIVAKPDSQCYNPDTDSYTISVTASGVEPLQYGLDKDNFTTDATLIVNAPGTYDVYVKDANGCIGIATAAFTILDPLGLSATITTYPKCNGTDGVVTLQGSGGTVVSPDYQYSLGTLKAPGKFVASGIFTNLSSGTYYFWVKDNATGCIKMRDVEIPIAALVANISLIHEDVSCNGGSDGTVTVTLDTAGTNSGYKYSLRGDKGLTREPQESPLFENLPADQYTVTVISDRGCEAQEHTIVNEPNAITVEAPIVTQFGCAASNSANNATITVSAKGGSGQFTIYEFIKIGTPNKVVQADERNEYTEANYDGGSYLIKVYDDKNCEGAVMVPVTIDPYISLDKIVTGIVNPITCISGQDIQVTVEAADQTVITVPLEYTITGTGTTVHEDHNATGLFTGLSIGNYLISVKNPATGCILEQPSYVTDVNTFELKAGNVTNIQCYGNDNGSVDLTLTDHLAIIGNDAKEFTYSITDSLGAFVTSGDSNAAGTTTITGLKSGVYIVKATLKNTPFCPVETTFAIEQPVAELQIEETHKLITCIPGNDGTITIKGSGGWPGNYQYELDEPIKVAYSGQYEFKGLTAGTYTLRVKDSKDCVAVTTVTLDNPKLIETVATASRLVCYGDKNGEIKVTATGGLGNNYYYVLNMLSVDPVISTMGQNEAIFKGLRAGTYSVTVTDGLNCTGTTAAVTIEEPAEIIATLIQASRKTCKASATLTLNVRGGTGLYEYSTDRTFATTMGSFTSSVTFDAGLGDHKYYVKDANGCIGVVSNTVTINEVVPLSLELDLIGAIVYCKGDAGATVEAIAQGGLGNYKYTLLDDAGHIIRAGQAESNFSLLPAGKYVVRVDSGDCQLDSDVITISEPANGLTASLAVTDATCNSENDGKIVVTATGGIGKLKYAISPNLSQFSDDNIFNHLEAGTYQILVNDENSCFQLLECEIKQPVVLSSKIVGPIIQETCEGNNDGAFSIDIFGGTPPYSVSLDSRDGVYTRISGTQYDFINLKGGQHTVYIKDIGCLIEMQVMMDAAVVLNPQVKIDTECANNTVQNAITVTVDKSNTNLADIDYSLDGEDFQSANTFINVAAGTHTVTARHTNGCEQTTLPFSIRNVSPLALTLTDGQLNEIVATATGGGGEYQYTLNGESYGSVNKFIIYKSGTYTVTVTDKNGCEATVSGYFGYIDVCIPNHFTPNGDGINDTWAPGCTISYKNLTFEIFDRHGRVIGTYRLGQSWDGRYNGTELPSGDYWYVLKLNDHKDNREFVGHFTLYR